MPAPFRDPIESHGLLDVLKQQQGAPTSDGSYQGVPWGLLGAWAKDNPGQAALTAGSFAPSPVGDVTGVVGDVKHYIENPDDATWGNIAMTGASLIPGVPPMAGALQAARKVVKKATPPDPLAMYRKQPGSDPRYLGAATDRTDKTFLRYKPKKIFNRLERSMAAIRNVNNPARKKLEMDIDRGVQPPAP